MLLQKESFNDCIEGAEREALWILPPHTYLMSNQKRMSLSIH